MTEIANVTLPSEECHGALISNPNGTSGTQEFDVEIFLKDEVLKTR